MKSTVLIPKKIRVGFQNRADTYTKKLAYVIYYDNTGKLRKETSWEGWRDKSIEPEEFDNTPTEGFVLNKKVGGYAGDWGNFRQAYVRVYDPRGFEFEITVPNLLYILEHTSSIKGKGLKGEFVYAWDGPDLLLLPTCAPDYAKLLEVNERRAQTVIKNADLKIGATYLTKQSEEWVYMGRFDCYDTCYRVDGQLFKSYRGLVRYFHDHCRALYHEEYDHYAYFGYRRVYNYEEVPECVGKQYFFHRKTEWGREYFEHIKSATGRFIDVVSEEPAPNYAELFEKLEHDLSYSPIDKTRSVFRPCTPEEIDKDIVWERDGPYTTVVDGTPVHADLERNNYNDPNSTFSIIPKTEKDAKLLKTVQGCQYDALGCGRGYGVIFAKISRDKLLEILPPYYTERYQANGNFYSKGFYNE